MCLSLHCSRYNKYQTFCGSCDVFPFDAHWTVAELSVCVVRFKHVERLAQQKTN